MRIDEFYNNAAKINLNGSLLALLPAILVMGGNLLIFHHKAIMILTVPFLIYSLISFQMFLKKKEQKMKIEKNLQGGFQNSNQTLFTAEKLVVFYHNTMIPQLLLYFSDGLFAGEFKRIRKKGTSLLNNEKTFLLTDHKNSTVGSFKIIGRKFLKVEVYDQKHEYIGCFEKRKKVHEKRNRIELLDATGRYVAQVEGSSYYMDEQVVNRNNRLICRLQRGFMPLEWSGHFPEANTPVFSLAHEMTEKDKLLNMALLINEFFIER